MREPGRDLDLPQEPLGADRGRQVGLQHLEGDLPLVLAVVREVDRRHPAAAEYARQRVALRQRCLQVLGDIGHRDRIAGPGRGCHV